MRVSGVTIILILFSLIACAQDPAYRNYTTSDGLPSNNVYSTIQDDEGFIWFATDNGVSRFDGTHFRNFSVDDSLTDRNVINMAEDSYGRLWFFTFSGNIYFYYKGKIYNRFNSKLLERLNSKSVFHNFFEDSKKNIWLSLNMEIVRITPSDEVTYFKNIIPRFVWEDSKGKIRSVSGAFSFVFNDTGFAKTRLPFYVLIKKAVRLPGDSTTFILGSTICKNGEKEISKTILAIYNLRSSRIEIDSVNNYSSPLIESVSMDNNGCIWLSSLNGASRFNIQNFSSRGTIDYPFFKNNCISNVFQDRNNNYWFTSFGSGIFIVPSLYTHSFNTNSGLVENNITSLVQLPDSSIMMGSKNGTIQVMKHGVIKDKNNSLVVPSGSLMRLDKDSHGNVWILTDVLLSRYSKGKLINIPDTLMFYKTLFVDSSDTVWVGTGNGLKMVVNNAIVRVSAFDGGIINRIYSIAQGPNHLLWLGTDKGLYVYNGSKLVSESQKYPVLSRKINAVAVSRDSTLWIASDDDGLFKIGNNGKLIHFSVPDGLLSNYCNNILTDGNKIYLATNNGLNILSSKNDSVYINSYSSANGLVSSHINQIIKESKGLFLMATDKGIIEFDEQKLQPPSESKPYIDAVYVNDINRSLARPALLNYNENNLQINFGAINFNVINGSTIFFYKLLGIDTGWNRTTSRSVKYNHLSPGDYTFYVMTGDKNADANNRAAFFKLHIKTPVWLTWWFKLISILIILSCIILLVKGRFDAYGKKINRQRQLAESELKALRAQINPHFIYNSLNSIQSFIMNNQKEDANVYLSKFAKLMRGILSYSRASTITLAEEIESLQLYLELETFVYNEQFSFNFSIDEQIDAEEVLIPSMILQPYIENAIIHGLAPVQQGGRINITFSKKNDALICTIEDNGIGRKKAAELGQQKAWKNHPSLGMQVTKERIDLLSIREGKKINLEINNITDGNGKSLGTLVRIEFPFVPAI